MQEFELLAEYNVELMIALLRPQNKMSAVLLGATLLKKRIFNSAAVIVIVESFIFGCEFPKSAMPSFCILTNGFTSYGISL